MSETEGKPKRRWLAVALWLLGGVLAVNVLARVGSTQKAPADSPSVAAGQSERAAVPNWTYSQFKNELDDSVTRVACTTSTNQIRQDFPYHNTNADLCVRRPIKGQYEFFVRLNANGQILCGIQSCEIPMRLDASKAEHVVGEPPTDHSSNFLFLNNGPRFYAQLKKSKRMILELTIYQQGDQQLFFDTGNLDFDAKPG